MRTTKRREVYPVLLAFAMASGAAFGQVHATESPVPKGTQTPEPMDRQGAPAAAPAATAGALSAARVFHFDEMPTRKMANGGESRDVTHGTLATGETVNLHESTQPAGATPSPLHVIQHTEFILVREGEVEFQHVNAAGETVAERVGAGGVIYVALGTRHALKNVGSGPASYLVVAIGGDAK